MSHGGHWSVMLVVLLLSLLSLAAGQTQDYLDALVDSILDPQVSEEPDKDIEDKDSEKQNDEDDDEVMSNRQTGGKGGIFLSQPGRQLFLSGGGNPGGAGGGKVFLSSGGGPGQQVFLSRGDGNPAQVFIAQGGGGGPGDGGKGGSK